jgi:hypothetical protein
MEAVPLHPKINYLRRRLRICSPAKPQKNPPLADTTKASSTGVAFVLASAMPAFSWPRTTLFSMIARTFREVKASGMTADVEEADACRWGRYQRMSPPSLAPRA